VLTAIEELESTSSGSEPGMANIQEQLTAMAAQIQALTQAMLKYPQQPNPAVVPSFRDLLPNVSGMDPPEDEEVLRLFISLKDNRNSHRLKARDLHEFRDLLILAIAAAWNVLPEPQRKALYNRARTLLAEATLGWTDALRLTPSAPTELLHLPPGFQLTPSQPPPTPPPQPTPPFRAAAPRGRQRGRGRGTRR
jgi:hypothetical protein